MASGAGVKLFTLQVSPFGQRVAIALKEKNIPFEQIEVDLFNKPEALLEANPIYKTVPTIIHNGKPVAESLVILQYLEDAFPGQILLMPKDAFERSKVRFWIDYIDKALSTSFGILNTKPGTPEKQAACEATVSTLKTLDEGMAAFSAEGPFFAGENFSLLDAVLVPFCNTLPLLQEIGGFTVPGTDKIPRLHQWMVDVRAHPSVSSVLPSVDESMAHLKDFLPKKRAAETAAAAAAVAE